MRTLTLGFSPCPNDTFIFDALVNGKIDSGNLRFDAVLEDVQTLNEWAMEGRLDVSKISYGVLPLALPNYVVLSSGGALGKGVGPLLVAAPRVRAFDAQAMSVAIPGRNTTAHLLFSVAYPGAARKQFMVFSDIEQAVLDGAVDAGVIIHESRFTYAARGLTKLTDLGEHWERQTRSPVPLGGIVARRDLDRALQLEIERLIRESVRHAFGRYPLITDYVRRHAQEMDETVMRRHVDLYVNDYSVDLGDEGRRAVEKLLAVDAQVNPGARAAARELFLTS
jgi:1,4-dihydroxy-6-naphthoate synthase